MQEKVKEWMNSSQGSQKLDKVVAESNQKQTGVMQLYIKASREVPHNCYEVEARPDNLSIL